jgi:D-alanyl-D-alanine carboxypeptidase
MTVIFNFIRHWRYRSRISGLHRELGVPADYASSRHLSLFPETRRLAGIGPDIYQREQQLHQKAIEPWQEMRHAAQRDGVVLLTVSGFRSVDYQADIIRRKLEKGLPMKRILEVSAAPGFSEHHTGRALDLTTPGSPVLEEPFEDSEAFAWLCEHAQEFGFHLSFPRDNPHGIAYEPWHWAWRG